MHFTKEKFAVHLTQSDKESIKKLYNGSRELCKKYNYCGNCPMFNVHKTLDVPCGCLTYYLVINGISATDDFEIIMESEK